MHTPGKGEAGRGNLRVQTKLGKSLARLPRIRKPIVQATKENKTCGLTAWRGLKPACGRGSGGRTRARGRPRPARRAPTPRPQAAATPSPAAPERNKGGGAGMPRREPREEQACGGAKGAASRKLLTSAWAAPDPWASPSKGAVSARSNSLPLTLLLLMLLLVVPATLMLLSRCKLGGSGRGYQNAPLAVARGKKGAFAVAAAGAPAANARPTAPGSGGKGGNGWAAAGQCGLEGSHRNARATCGAQK